MVANPFAIHAFDRHGALPLAGIGICAQPSQARPQAIQVIGNLVFPLGIAAADGMSEIARYCHGHVEHVLDAFFCLCGGKSFSLPAVGFFNFTVDAGALFPQAGYAASNVLVRIPR